MYAKFYTITDLHFCKFYDIFSRSNIVIILYYKYLYKNYLEFVIIYRYWSTIILVEIKTTFKYIMPKFCMCRYKCIFRQVKKSFDKALHYFRIIYCKYYM